MSTQPNPQPADPSALATTLNDMMLGLRKTQLLYVAAKLGIADLLHDGAKSSDELAQAVGVHPRALYRVLRTLAGLGVFAETPHTHQAKPLVMDLLPAVRADRCWDAFSADSSDTPPRGSA